MEDFAIHLLVLSHVYVVPHLKRVCESEFESSLLNKENVIDVFQLALLCDAPRLGLLCHRMILNNFEEVSTSEGWQAMKESHPRLQKELLRSVAYELNVIIQNLNNFLYPKVLYFHSFLMIFVSKFCLCRAWSKETGNRRRYRLIHSSMKQWRLLFIYVEMDAEK